MDIGVEDEFIGEEDEGRIRFTFKIPPGFASPEFSETHLRQHLCSRLWGRSLCHFMNLQSRIMTILPFPPLRPLSPMSVSPPSAIPCATALKRFEGHAKDVKYLPSCSPSLQLPASQHSTSPSNKYDGPHPSCLLQWITKPTKVPTFIPQPATRARASSSIAGIVCM